MTDDGCFSQAMVLPCSIYLKASSSSQTLKTAFLPRSQKSRQKIQISFVRLQKDFSYTGSSAHVAVQLEGRMSTQEIGIYYARPTHDHSYGICELEQTLLQ